MNIQPAGYARYSGNLYNQNISSKGNLRYQSTELLSNEIKKSETSQKRLRNLLLAGITTVSMLLGISACDKEDLNNPKPTGYTPVEIPEQVPPTNDTLILNKYNRWCEKNWPLYLRPDYFGSVPENIDEITEQWHQEVINWWKNYGIDFNPWDTENP